MFTKKSITFIECLQSLVINKMVLSNTFFENELVLKFCVSVFYGIGEPQPGLGGFGQQRGIGGSIPKTFTIRKRFT